VLIKKVFSGTVNTPGFINPLEIISRDPDIKITTPIK